MISRYEGRGDADENYARLLQAIDNYIANLKVVFDDRVTEEYKQLFIEHIGLISDLITAQMENNVDEINRITQALYQMWTKGPPGSNGSTLHRRGRGKKQVP